jgi:hypothetical protein
VFSHFSLTFRHRRWRPAVVPPSSPARLTQNKNFSHQNPLFFHAGLESKLGIPRKLTHATRSEKWVPVETSLSPPFAVFWLLLLSFLFRIWVCVCVCDVCGGCVTVKQFWFGLVSLCSEMVVLMLFMLLLFCNLRKEVRVWQTPFLSFFFCFLLFFV